MTPDDLIQLMRECSLHFVKEQIERLYATDQVLYERLVNMYQRAKLKTEKKKK